MSVKHLHNTSLVLTNYLLAASNLSNAKPAYKLLEAGDGGYRYWDVDKLHVCYAAVIIICTLLQINHKCQHKNNHYGRLIVLH